MFSYIISCIYGNMINEKNEFYNKLQNKLQIMNTKAGEWMMNVFLHI